MVLQSYKNNSSVAIEAKYVFPLGDMAAGEIEMVVCMTSLLHEECNNMLLYCTCTSYVLGASNNYFHVNSAFTKIVTALSSCKDKA